MCTINYKLQHQMLHEFIFIFITGIKPTYKVDQKNEIGGALVQPHAFTSLLSTHEAKEIANTVQLLSCPNNCTAFLFSVPRPRYVISVAEQASISSDVFAVPGHSTSKKGCKEKQFGVHQYWSPYTGFSGRVQLCDGGAVDNTSVTALLRRKVSRII